MARITHGGCAHAGFTSPVMQAALQCAQVSLSDMDARNVYVMLHKGWTVIRQGVTFKLEVR